MPAVRDDGAFYGGPGVPMRSLLLTQVSRMCRKATVESRAVSILSMQWQMFADGGRKVPPVPI